MGWLVMKIEQFLNKYEPSEVLGKEVYFDLWPSDDCSVRSGRMLIIQEDSIIIDSKIDGVVKAYFDDILFIQLVRHND
jgi:hypothetical protein